MPAPNAAIRAATLAVALLLAGPARADHHTVKVAKDDKVGAHLTDAKGMTLYEFKKDSPGKSACAEPCVAKWPIYFREKVAVTGALKDSDFGTITRDDGKQQTTYKGKPLYYFAADKAPGQTNGQGVLDMWTVATP